jgi:hypothetical protein
MRCNDVFYVQQALSSSRLEQPQGMEAIDHHQTFEVEVEWHCVVTTQRRRKKGIKQA